MSEQAECEVVFEGVAGDDLSIPVQLLVDGIPEKLGDGDGVTEIVGEFTDGNNAEVQVTLTGGKVVRVDETCGRISLELAAAVSATLKTDKIKPQTFSVYRIKSGKKRTWLFEGKFLLKPRPVPAA